MYAYHQVLLAELHIDRVPQSLATSRRAARRFAQLEALRNATDQSGPTARPLLVRRLIGLVRTPA